MAESRRITYQEYNDFCQSLPATSHVVQWGGSHVWKVGGKVFAVGGWEREETVGSDKPAVSFKASEHNFLMLQEQEGFRPAPYMASRGMKWIQMHSITLARMDELQYYLQESHRLVAQGLTKKLQKELGLL